MDPADAAPSPPSELTGKDPGLPPVQPPSAGFLVQLFLIPMIIVSIIVLVWLAFSWLAHQGVDPHDLARSLRTRNDASWQKAYNLSNMLRDAKNDHLKDDKELAGELVAVLQRELNVRPTPSLPGVGERTYRTPERVRLREFLCKALGEFRLELVADVLIQAVQQEEAEEDLLVRRKAAEALAVLASNVEGSLQDRRDVMQALREASRDRSDNPEQRLARGELRAAAGFALGLVGSDEALDRLETMLSDPYANARFNAATGLARHGDPRCLPTLAAMLDPDNPDATRDELSDEARQFKRAEVLGNGIRAARLFADASAKPDLGPVLPALQNLADADLSRDVKLAAKETLLLLKEREAGSAGRND